MQTQDADRKILLYHKRDGSVELEATLEHETVWLSLIQIANLFGRDKSVISRHLKNVYDTGELNKEATVANFATVQQEGGRSITRKVVFYNLDAIFKIVVGKWTAQCAAPKGTFPTAQQ